MYNTECPKCKEPLRVQGTADFDNCLLWPDGYTVEEWNSDNEVAYCLSCGWTGPLESLDMEGDTGAGAEPQRLRCKNPKCAGHRDGFSSADALYAQHLDSYICPLCGGSDVGVER